jgi:polyphosphate kinase 2
LILDSSNLGAVVSQTAQGDWMSGTSRLTEEEYLALLEPMAQELSAMARWVSETGQRMIVILEGRDTAGKGGSIDMIARLLNPRQCRVVALPAPSERERTQWYFQRYIEHLPAAGEIVLFDRSWYNRAGVERVMGFATQDEVQDFLNATPQFERHLLDDGMLLFKYWLCCDQEIQEHRFENRLNNPMKRWKLSPIDMKARVHYDDYTEAREMMLSATHTDFAPRTFLPWTSIAGRNLALSWITWQPVESSVTIPLGTATSQRATAPLSSMSSRYCVVPCGCLLNASTG